ncbi:MAG: GNAT family N-acetyltransferase [Bacteroidales bacterium]|jgi:hypothetical protein
MKRVINHRENLNRFETEEDGFTGYVQYELSDGIIDLTHTIVPKEIEGRGVAASIVAFVLDYAREKGLRVKPSCSYVRTYIERHKELYGNLEDKENNKFLQLNSGGHSCGINNLEKH